MTYEKIISPNTALPNPTAEAALTTLVQSLNDIIARNARLSARCEEMAQTGPDPLRAVHVAAKMTQSNAKLVELLSRVAHVETRHRSIIEQIPPDPRYSNHKLRYSEEYATEEDARVALEAKLDRLLEASRGGKLNGGGSYYHPDDPRFDTAETPAQT